MTLLPALNSLISVFLYCTLFPVDTSSLFFAMHSNEVKLVIYP